MKSILHEASTISGAINKAWLEANKPEEFSVRIYEQGQKGFLGIWSKKAVISLIFEPKKIENKNQSRYNNRPRYQDNKRFDNSRADNSRSDNSRAYSSRSDNSRVDNSRSDNSRADNSRSDNSRVDNSRVDNSRVDNSNDRYNGDRSVNSDYGVWDDAATDHVRDSLIEITKIMNIDKKFSCRVDRHLLRIEFEKPIFSAPSEERMLFASYAFILMQFLKRKFKRGLRGCRIAISSVRK